MNAHKHLKQNHLLEYLEDMMEQEVRQHEDKIRAAITAEDTVMLLDEQAFREEQQRAMEKWEQLHMQKILEDEWRRAGRK
jgi:hypothetical protein